MKVVAILDKSAGNETTGEAWQETALFDDTATIADVLNWAVRRHNSIMNADEIGRSRFRGRLQITIAQEGR